MEKTSSSVILQTWIHGQVLQDIEFSLREKGRENSSKHMTCKDISPSQSLVLKGAKSEH